MLRLCSAQAITSENMIRNDNNIKIPIVSIGIFLLRIYVRKFNYIYKMTVTKIYHIPLYLRNIGNKGYYITRYVQPEKNDNR
mgnify:CR=1